MNKKAGDTILCKLYENYCQGFNKCMNKRRVKSTRWFTGKMAGPSWSQAEILPEGRALSEHV